MKKIIILAALFTSAVTFSQENDSLKTRPGQVTFFYPLGTNGLESTSYTNNFSFNVLYGVNGGVNGLEFGGLVNVNLGTVKGVQFGGIANINTGQTDGIMFGGICNVSKDSSNAVSFAGISNVMAKSATGLHFAGISNTVNGDFLGAQFAGITNTVNGSVTGAQMAGISNLNTGDFTGLQLAGISNVNTAHMKGAQIGLINTAKTVHGFQLGLINVAESFEKGVPLGLISYVKNGFHALEVSSNESIYANISFKLGVDHLYTIYKIGFARNNSTDYFTYGMGIGGLHSFTDHLKVSLDLSANHALESVFIPRLDILTKADFALRYHLNKHIGFYAGPSFNVYITQNNGENTNPILSVPYALYTDKWWNNDGSTSLWIGGNVGVSLMF